MLNRLNVTDVISDRDGYRIPRTDLRLTFRQLSKPLDMRDSLVILVQVLFSATERINAGGKPATEAISVLSHKYGDVQIQVIGLRARLLPFKAAQALEGLATIGAKIGFYESTIIVVEDRIGTIGRIDFA